MWAPRCRILGGELGNGGGAGLDRVGEQWWLVAPYGAYMYVGLVVVVVVLGSASPASWGRGGGGGEWCGEGIIAAAAAEWRQGRLCRPRGVGPSEGSCIVWALGGSRHAAECMRGRTVVIEDVSASQVSVELIGAAGSGRALRHPADRARG